ncbi:hypothetical protein U9M48_015843 [Paspalum notatum var. saurae]|uniref:Peptidase S9 prolyl oligopeptidase catalytic domain-containing protein n=1 Tax=Paspalum notatum var. saurae TaxID=547442 RepID=A0AAQ3T3V7_PASNO
MPVRPANTIRQWQVDPTDRATWRSNQTVQTRPPTPVVQYCHQARPTNRPGPAPLGSRPRRRGLAVAKRHHPKRGASRQFPPRRATAAAGEGGEMAGWLKALAYGAGGVAVAGLAALVALQERLVYVPVLPGLARAYPITPARLRLAYEDVWLRAADGVRLHSWFIRHSPTCQGPTILFFQENAGNIAHRLEFVRLMMQRLQCNVFMLSYRGYGESDGYPSQKGITYDAQAALDHLAQRKDIDTTRIVIFGRSLGGAVGAVLAKNNPDKVAALILENTFTSILDMAGIMLPFLRWFIGGSSSKGPKLLNCVVRSPWNTLDIVGEVKQPILFLSGLQDELVPPPHMKTLYEKAFEHNTNCRFVDFPSGMHMDTWMSGGDRYWRTIQLFLDQYASEVQNRDASFKSEISEDVDFPG